MEPPVMMVHSVLHLIHARKVFAQVPGVPVRQVPRAVRRPKPAIVLLMQTVMMEISAIELRPVMVPVRMAHRSTALTMRISVMELKAAMRTLISA